MLSNLLSPEVQVQKILKRQLPQIKKDLSVIIDDLLLQAADQCQANPFELVLIISKQQNKAIASVFNRQKESLISMDIGALLKEKFFEQLSVVPAVIKDLVLEKLEGQDVTEVIVKALRGKRLLIHYDKQDELVFVEVTKDSKKVIDLDEFFNTFEF